ncbi:uncharacterized protein [Palaemon carinicauda]|uniref:uncharacterized protein n=1 Tax=Palaemon carinicauda TaxID=392227 RepID=UPI0035B5EFBA
MYADKPPMELKRLSDTRWACGYFSVHVVSRCLPAILKVLDDITHEPNPERSLDVSSLKGLVDFQFVLMLCVFQDILGAAKCTSDILQSPNTDLAKAMDIIDTIKDRIAMLRSREEDFEPIWQHAADIVNDSGITVPDVGHKDLIISRRSRRQIRAPERLHDSILLELLVQHRGGNTKEEFRTDIFYVILDTVASELSDRFTSGVMRGIHALNPANEGFLNLEKIKPLAKIYSANLDDLVHELPQAKRL